MNKKFKINIKGAQWVVKLVDTIDNSDTGVVGLTNYDDKVIFVRNDSCDIRDTIIHELLHATLFECGSDMCRDESIVFLISKIFSSIVHNAAIIYKDVLNNQNCNSMRTKNAKKGE